MATLIELDGASPAIGRDVWLVIEDEALVGMGAIVLQHARVGSGAMLAAGSVLSERQAVPPGVMAAGVPAREK